MWCSTKDIPQLREKLAVLRADPQLAADIARNGQDLVVSQFSFARIGQRIVDAPASPAAKGALECAGAVTFDAGCLMVANLAQNSGYMILSRQACNSPIKAT